MVSSPTKRGSPSFFSFVFYLKKCFLPSPSLGMLYHILWWRMLLVRHIVFYFRDNQQPFTMNEETWLNF